MKNRENIQYLLFDLDGTIIQPEKSIFDSIRYALGRMDIPVGQEKELRRFIGPPLQESFSRYYGLDTATSIDAVNLYREYYAEKGIHENQLYEGIYSELKLLDSQGFELYIATSKPTVFARKILDHHNLDALFRDIVGANLNHTRNEKTEIVAHILREHRIDPSLAWMIGDRKHDMIGAVNNGVKGLGVTYGYGDEQELRKAGATLIAHRCTEISHSIHQYDSQNK